MRDNRANVATNTKLERIAWLSKQDSAKEFECLMHLFNEESLTDCFRELDKKKAVGVDGITKMAYGGNLNGNIEQLTTKMKNMAYRPGPVREVLIPKEGKPGTMRSLGISNLEDKIVQKMTQKTLESIYEPLFLECSYGFRPRRGCHIAIKAILDYLYRNEIQTIIDIDLKNFFDSIDHRLMEDILKIKIKDPKFMRYMSRMFKSGILTKGELRMNEEGVPQGSICSPVLANIFAHYAIDLWIENEVKPACRGAVQLFRYADDVIICSQYKDEAERIMAALGKRLAKFKLQLNEDKTKLVSFSKREFGNGIKQDTFDFLGFTFYLGKSEAGRVMPKLKTRAKTIRTKLKKVKEWVRKFKNEVPLKEIWKTLGTKLKGHIAYYGVSHNVEGVNQFIRGTKWVMFKWLNRRSQRKSLSWKKYLFFIEANPFPKARVVHPLF